MKRVLITGASGLVGKATIENLLCATTDYEIYAASSQVLYGTNDRLHYILNKDIEEVLKKKSFDVFLQLAFPRNVQESQWAQGFEFVVDVLYMVKKYGVKRIINISSQSIYGWNRKKEATESHSIFLNSPYTTGKYFTELLVNKLFEDIPHTNIRLSTVIGPTTIERVPNKLFSRIAKNEKIYIHGGEQIFSFLDIRDVAEGLTCLICSNGIWRKQYNLGTAEHATLLQIAKEAVRIGKKYGYSSDIVLESAKIELNNMLDTRAMQEDFNWRAKYSLSESLEYIFEENYVSK